MIHSMSDRSADQRSAPTSSRFQQPRGSVEGGAVSDCWVSAAWMRRPSLQGRTCGVPAIRHCPANSRIARFLKLTLLLQVQGAALPKTQKKQQAVACCFGVMVRPERFELPTAWFVARYSIQLSYGRQLHKLVVLMVCGAPGEIRTPDRLVRSQVLYPTELRARGTQSILLLHFTASSSGGCWKPVEWCARRDSNSRPPGS